MSPAPAPRWPDDWAVPLAESPATTAPTRRALLARLARPVGLPPGAAPTPAFFAPDAYETFAAACARLVPSDGLDAAIDVAPAIDARLGARDEILTVEVPPEQGRLLSWLHDNAEVLDQHREETGGTTLRVRIDPDLRGKLQGHLKRAGLA